MDGGNIWMEGTMARPLCREISWERRNDHTYGVLSAQRSALVSQRVETVWTGAFALDRELSQSRSNLGPETSRTDTCIGSLCTITSFSTGPGRFPCSQPHFSNSACPPFFVCCILFLTITNMRKIMQNSTTIDAPPSKLIALILALFWPPYPGPGKIK
jgi:hypothetical protein